MLYLTDQEFHSFKKVFLFFFYVTINTCSDDVKCGTAWIQVFLHAFDIVSIHLLKLFKKNANVQKKAHSPNRKLAQQKPRIQKKNTLRITWKIGYWLFVLW